MKQLVEQQIVNGMHMMVKHLNVKMQFTGEDLNETDCDAEEDCSWHVHDGVAECEDAWIETDVLKQITLMDRALLLNMMKSN